MKRIIIAVLSILMIDAAFAQERPPVTLSKVFTPSTIGPGSVSTITLTITNGLTSPATELAFTDTLPAAVTIAEPANVSTNCDLGLSGSLSAPDGGSIITLSDAEIGGTSACTITVDVTASEPGTHTNPAVTLSWNAGSSLSLPIDLTVDDGLPGFSKSFSPASVPLGDRSTLTFTIDNGIGEGTAAIANLDFTDNLPVGMVIADPSGAATDCISPVLLDTTIDAISGTGIIRLDANGFGITGYEVLPAGASCTVTVDVQAVGAGSLDNVTGDLLADFNSAGKASDTLEATITPLAIQKSFVDDPTPPGGTVTLEFKISSLDRNSPATDIAFTDDLAAALAGLTFESLLSNDCGGAVGGVGSTNISFSGGTLAPASTCTIAVTLAVPAGATPGIYTNTTGAISATVNGSPVVGNVASDDLYAEPAPVLIKEFLEVVSLNPDPVVDAGATSADVVLRFTVTNTSNTSAATDVTFIDELTDGSGGSPPDTTTGFLPFPVSVTLPTDPDPPCGVGSSLALVSLDTDRQGLQLTGGSLAAAGTTGDSCSFDVTVTIPQGFAPGVYLNTTEEPTATVDGATRTGKPASDTLTVVGAPTLTKSFADDPVGPGTTVTLEFTLRYGADANGDATAIAFTDDLTTVLAGLTAASVDTNTCTGSTVDISTPTNIDFSGGSMVPGASCTVSLKLDVPGSAVPGTYPNTTSGVDATVDGLAVTSRAASDDLKVTGLLFTKQFLKNPVIAGETTTLRFTVDNIHPTDDATIIVFTDNLAANLPGLAATGPPTVNNCGGTLSGTTSLTYTGGSVTSGNSCTIEVEVLVPLTAADGVYRNVTSSLSADQGGSVSVDPAVDTLSVNSNLIQLTKTFTDDPVAPGDSVTLELTLTNLDAVRQASAVAFTDDLGAALANLTFDSVLFDDCGGTVSGTGTTSISVSGVSLAGAASCTTRVSLSVPPAAAGGIYTNITSAVSGTIDGFDVTGDAASDKLEVVDLLLFSKSFDGPTTATGTAKLTFTITNPGANAATGLGFTDDLNAVIAGLIATGLPAQPCGPGSSLSGISFLTFSGGELAGSGGTCSFDVDVLVPASVTAGTFANTTSVLSQNGISVAKPATADLTIEPPPAFAKAFGTDPIFAGDVSTLSFAIDNTASAVAVTGIAFTDALPATLQVASPSVVSNACGGTLTAVAGAGSISLSGGSVAAGASCSIDVDVTGTVAGTHVNTTGDLTSSSGNSGTASDSLTVIASADISVTKTDGVTTAIPGGSLAYTIVAANAGPSDDPSVLLSDTFPAVLTCTYSSVAAGGATGNTLAGAGDLAETLSMPSGSSVTYTVSCDIDASAAGTLSNTATVTASINDSDPGNNSATDADTVLAPSGDISVTKSDGVTSAVPGESLTYTIVAANAGPSDDPAVALGDTLPADLTCTYTSAAAGGASGNTAAGAGDLAETLSMPSGSSVTYTVNCDIDASATGTLSNTATVTASITDSDPGNNSATDADTVLAPSGDISVTKTDGVTSAVPGESLIYTIVATNNGPGDDPSVALADVFPDMLSCSWTSAAAGGATGNTAAGAGDLAETLSMPSGSSVTYTVSCDIDASATGTLSNTATVTASITDNDPGNNSATDADTVLAPEADLSITKTDGVTEATPGETLTYTIVASNAGPSDDPTVSLTDVLPVDLSCTYTSAVTGGASGNTAAGEGDLAESLSLPAGSSVTYTLLCDIDPSATGTLSNTATVSGAISAMRLNKGGADSNVMNDAGSVSTEVDNNSGNNSATDDDTELKPVASLSISKSSGTDTVLSGSELTYAVTITNEGPSDSSGGAVTDTLPADLSFVSSASGCSEAAGIVTCSFGSLAVGSQVELTFVALVADTASGTIQNVASVNGNEPNPNAGAEGVDMTRVQPADTPIPTLSGWMLLLMMVLFGGIGMRLTRRIS